MRADVTRRGPARGGRFGGWREQGVQWCGWFRQGAAAAQAPDIDPEQTADHDWVEDYLQITDVQPGKIWFECGVGPISVPRTASNLARPGWSLHITAARTGGAWHLLEVGFVYP